MFTMVRQAELSQDWTYFRGMAPNLIRAGEFLWEIRDRARGSNTPNGRYGLLAEGFGEGGMNGIRPEFTNTGQLESLGDNSSASGIDHTRADE